MKFLNSFLHFFYSSVSLGNEERVSSPMSTFFLIISVVGLWWVLEAAAWKWSRRSFMVLVAGPGEVLVALQMLEEWWALVVIRWMVVSADCSQPDVPFFGFLPQTSPGFSREEVLGCPAAEGDGAAGCGSCPCPFCVPLQKPERVFYGMWPRDAFSFRMSLNLSSSAAKPSAACVGHSLKTKALKKQ